jgi:probable HAF family extracellular repeat protein
MLKRIGRLMLVGLVLTLGAVPAVVADGYTVADLGTVGGKANSWVWQQTVNEGGVIAAYANDVDNPNAFFGDVPFLWDRGRVTVLPELEGAIDTIPYSLNDSGQVVGSSQPEGEGPHAVLWDRAPCGCTLYRPRRGDPSEARCHHPRVSWRIRTLSELPGDNFSDASAVNNRRQVVGVSANFTPEPFSLAFHAVLWQENRIVRLPPLPDAGMADWALDINEHGQIVGFSGPAFGLEHPALWDKGSVTDLGLLGGDWAEANAINNNGQVVGFGQTAAGDTHAFFWESGSISDLGALDDDEFSGAFDINQKGQIVGFSGASITDVTTSHAVLWEEGVMIELQTQIPADSGWTLLAALGINERGQISGYGIHDGEYRAFVLTPVK